jgi:hypothetical protein
MNNFNGYNKYSMFPEPLEIYDKKNDKDESERKINTYSENQDKPQNDNPIMKILSTLINGDKNNNLLSNLAKIFLNNNTTSEENSSSNNNVNILASLLSSLMKSNTFVTNNKNSNNENIDKKIITIKSDDLDIDNLIKTNRN